LFGQVCMKTRRNSKVIEQWCSVTHFGLNVVLSLLIGFCPTIDRRDSDICTGSFDNAFRISDGVVTVVRIS
jgi:hypothetical protein